MSNRIDVTGVNLREFIRAVYDLSGPQGLGYLHYKTEPLTDEEIDACLKRGSQFAPGLVVCMDYVNGRACKMDVFEENGRLYIVNPWYDHTTFQLEALLTQFKIEFPKESQHGVACNCADCVIQHSRHS